MRSTLCLMVLPVVLAACASTPPPPPPPVVINTTQAPPPPVIIPASPDINLVSQCQGLFAQALSGEPVNYGNPTVASAGGATTVHLSAQPMSPTPVPLVHYTCSYSGTMLTAAGLS